MRHASTHTAPRKSGRARAILAAGTVLGLGAVVTFAAFTDNASMSTEFTAGKVDIQINESDGPAQTPYKLEFKDSDAMAAGAAVYGKLTVTNVGSLDFTYTMSAPTGLAGDDPLAATMTVGIKKVAGATCDAEAFSAEGSTEVVADSTKLKDLKIDTARPLAAKNGSETLCFKAAIPADADAKVMGEKVTPTFVFTAQQKTA